MHVNFSEGPRRIPSGLHLPVISRYLNGDRRDAHEYEINGALFLGPLVLPCLYPAVLREDPRAIGIVSRWSSREIYFALDLSNDLGGRGTATRARWRTCRSQRQKEPASSLPTEARRPIPFAGPRDHLRSRLSRRTYLFRGRAPSNRRKSTRR